MALRCCIAMLHMQQGTYLEFFDLALELCHQALLVLKASVELRHLEVTPAGKNKLRLVWCKGDGNHTGPIQSVIFWTEYTSALPLCKSVDETLYPVVPNDRIWIKEKSNNYISFWYVLRNQVNYRKAIKVLQTGQLWKLCLNNSLNIVTLRK